MISLKPVESADDGLEKVNFILPSLGVGGAEKVCLELAEKFIERGKKVEFFLIVPLVQLDIPEGVEVTCLSHSRTKPLWFSAVTALFRLSRVFERTCQSQVFVVSVRGAVILALLASLLSFKSPNLFIREAALYSKRTWYPTWLHRQVLRFLYSRAAGVIAVSESVRKQLVEHFGFKGNVTTINNPVAIDKIKALSEMPVEKSRFGFTFLAVGRLVKEKGFSYLISAFSRIAKSDSCGLYIVGAGELEKELREEATKAGVSDQVIFLGFKSNPYPWYKAADVFVLSSIEEGFVNVLAEALAIGVPRIVATRCGGGPEELLVNHPCSWLVSPGDVDQLAGALLKAKNFKMCNKKVGNALVLDSFTVSECYLKILSSSFSSGPRSTQSVVSSSKQ